MDQNRRWNSCSYNDLLLGFLLFLGLNPISTGRFFPYLVPGGGVFRPPLFLGNNKGYNNKTYSCCSLNNELLKYNNDNQLVTCFVARLSKNKGNFAIFYLLNKTKSI